MSTSVKHMFKLSKLSYLVKLSDSLKNIHDVRIILWKAFEAIHLESVIQQVVKIINKLTNSMP